MYRYNTRGELISKTSKNQEVTYTYDKRSRLIAVVYAEIESTPNTPLYSSKLGGSFSAPSRRSRITRTFGFEYDPLGRRIAKHYKSFLIPKGDENLSVIPKGDENLSVIPNSIGDPVSNLKDGFPIKVGNDILEYHHRYLYDGEDIVAIYEYESDRLLATLIHDRSVDTPLSITTYDSEDETLKTQLSESEYLIYQHSLRRTYYYHRDHQNSIIALTNKEGKIVERYDYDPFGTIILEEHTKGVETLNPYRYTGREYDAPDLYYYRARYYDPTIGRFITPDPIGYLSGDFNFYRYVGNDPVNFVDPLGLASKACSKANDKLDKAKKKALEKLERLNSIKKIAAKKAAKKIATLPLKAVPILGWAMAAYDVYDVVTTGMDIADMIKEYDNAADAVEAAASELDACEKKEKGDTKKKEDGDKIKGKPRRKCGEKQKHKDRGTDSDRNEKKAEEQMDSDHIPSQEHVKRDIDKQFKGRKDYTADVAKCMKKYVSENMETIMLPNDIHSGKGAKTAQTQPNTNAYKDWANDFKTKNGREPSLHEIAKRETDIIEKEIDKKGRSNDPCGKKIKEGLGFFKNLDKDYFKNLYKEALKNCKGE